MTGDLSVHQMVALQTLVMMKKIVQSGKPAYIYDKIKPQQPHRPLRGGVGLLNLPNYKLSILREGFIYRGVYLYNSLEEHVRNELEISRFKEKCKGWVMQNVSVKPKPHFRKCKRKYSKITKKPDNKILQAKQTVGLDEERC